MLTEQYLSVAQTAALLGVREPLVHRWIKLEDIAATKQAGRWLVDAASVARFKGAQRAPGRPFAPRSAWSLLILASGGETSWLKASERYRFRVALDHDGVEGMARKLSRRDRSSFLYAHPGILERIAGESNVMPAGIDAAAKAGIGLLGSSRFLDVRVSFSGSNSLIDRYALAESSEVDANVRLRVVADDAWPLATNCEPRISAALDMADELDARSRREGLAVLRQIDGEKLWKPAR